MKITDIISDPPGPVVLKKQSQGLGDSIKKITDAMKIPQCGGCRKRQEKLNRLVPYHKKGNNKE